MSSSAKKICILDATHRVFDDRMYWKEALSLKKAGYEVLILNFGKFTAEGVSNHGIHWKKIQRKKLHPNRLINGLLKYLFFKKSEYAEMLNEAEKFSPDFYHFHDYRPLRLLSSLKKKNQKLGFFYSLREPRDLNYVISRKGLVNVLLAGLIQNWEYKKCQLLDYIFVVDDGLYERCKKNIPSVNVKPIYNYTNLAHQRQNIPFQDRKFDLTYVGGLIPTRGGMRMLELVKELKSSKPEIQFLILGNVSPDSFKKELLHFIDKYGLTENVIFKSYVPHNEVNNYYNQSKIGLNLLDDLPAYQHIMQIKLYEYMNFGLPIICSNFGEMKRIVEGSKVGLAVNQENIKEAANKILEILENPEVWRNYSQAGYEAVDREFNWNLEEKKLLDIYAQFSERANS